MWSLSGAFWSVGGGLFGALGGERAPASKSAAASLPATSAIHGELIPGIGATRANWDALHTLNAANNNGADYGDDPSLPSYVTNNGAVYRDVDDRGTGRIQVYTLAMHTVDARRCYGSCGKSTVRRDGRMGSHARSVLSSGFQQPDPAGRAHVMAEAELQYIQPDGTPATSPDKFNIASIWLDDAGVATGL